MVAVWRPLEEGVTPVRRRKLSVYSAERPENSPLSSRGHSSHCASIYEFHSAHTSYTSSVKTQGNLTGILGSSNRVHFAPPYKYLPAASTSGRGVGPSTWLMRCDPCTADGEVQCGQIRPSPSFAKARYRT